MAQRERLGHLKFMQKAKFREEQEKKAKEDEVAANENEWVVPADSRTSRTKCVVIVEGDPKPSADSGRMSFQSVEPSVESTNNSALLKVAVQVESSQKSTITR